MDTNETARGVTGEGRSKRPYEPPRIESETIFETTALACGKISSSQPNCNMHMQNS